MISEKPFSVSSSFSLALNGRKENPFGDKLKFIMGRDALEYSLVAAGINEKNNVLFPAYTCIEPLVPFLKLKCPIYYYDINDDLKPDFIDLKKTIKEKNITHFFWINYFGLIFPEYSSFKKELEGEVIFIEDCSHSVLSEDSGKTGDIVFASFRKVLPVPDGGYADGKMINTSPKYKSSVIAALSAGAILIKTLKIFKDIKVNRTKIKSAGHTNYSDMPVNETFLPMSALSRRILARINYEQEKKQRLEKFGIWKQLLADIPHTSMIADPGPGVIPSGYPILIKDREKVYEGLKRKGIYLKIDWEVPEVINENNRNSRKIALNSVTLPIHRNVGETDLKKIKEAIINIIGTDWRFIED